MTAYDCVVIKKTLILHALTPYTEWNWVHCWVHACIGTQHTSNSTHWHYKRKFNEFCRIFHCINLFDWSGSGLIPCCVQSHHFTEDIQTRQYRSLEAKSLECQNVAKYEDDGAGKSHIWFGSLFGQKSQWLSELIYCQISSLALKNYC